MFAPATRQRRKLRLALAGPSGSGKTYSALCMAAGLGGKVALVDTERGSASLYSDLVPFDVAEIEPPYTVGKYVAAIKSAGEAGYGVLVIDSLSHAWAGEGGILETVDAVQARGGNKFVAWGPAGKAQNELVNAILAAPMHVIVTMRSKQEYAVEQDARGKQTIRKLGMAPVQRDGLEYEFDVVLDIGQDHLARATGAGKDRTRLFAGQEPIALSAGDGARLLAWLDQGEAAGPSVADLRGTIGGALKLRGWTVAQVAAALARHDATTADGVPASARAELIQLLAGDPPAANSRPED